MQRQESLYAQLRQSPVNGFSARGTVYGTTRFSCIIVTLIRQIVQFIKARPYLHV